MLLLSDGDLVGTCQQFQGIDSAVSKDSVAVADSATNTSKCGFFASSDLLEQASDLLSTTTWDHSDRTRILESKARVQSMAGIHVEKTAVDSALAGAKAAASRFAAAGAVADEHDSYEALVREAGY